MMADTRFKSVKRHFKLFTLSTGLARARAREDKFRDTLLFLGSKWTTEGT